MTKTIKPMIRIHNADTNEIIDREMTDSEYAAYEAHNSELNLLQSEAEVKANKRAELLSRLGITEEEARILLG